MGLMTCGLMGLVCAAWSNSVDASRSSLLGLYVYTYGQMIQSSAERSRHARWLLTAACLIAVLPYLKNMLVHGNPFWPMKLPLVGDMFPYALDTSTGASCNALSI